MEISTAYENYRVKIVEVMETDEGNPYLIRNVCKSYSI